MKSPDYSESSKLCHNTISGQSKRIYAKGTLSDKNLMFKNLQLKRKQLFPICPNSGKLFYWRLFQGFFVQLTLFVVGYQAAFDASRNAWHYVIIYLGDLMYLMNTLLYFLTAIKDKGRVIRDTRVIQKKNLNVYFVVDVVSLLPLEIFGFASSMPLYVAALLRLNRVLRIIRVTHFLSKWAHCI